MASDADFQAFVALCSASFDAIGMTKTADTGQINPATVSRPANSAVGGYEIRSLGDSLMGTYPVYLKIEYGSNTSNSYQQVWITIGKGSNGSGTITSVIHARQALAASTITGALHGCASRGPGGISWVIGPGNSQLGFHVERSLNSIGVATGDALLVVPGMNNSTHTTSWHVYQYAAPTSYWVKGFSPVCIPSIVNGYSITAANPFATGSAPTAMPLPICCPGVTPWISRQLIAVPPGDLLASTTFKASPYVGLSNTYRGGINDSGVWQGFLAPIFVTASVAYPACFWWE